MILLTFAELENGITYLEFKRGTRFAVGTYLRYPRKSQQDTPGPSSIRKSQKYEVPAIPAFVSASASVDRGVNPINMTEDTCMLNTSLFKSDTAPVY